MKVSNGPEEAEIEPGLTFGPSQLVLWTCMLLSSGAALTGFAEIAVYGTRQLR